MKARLIIAFILISVGPRVFAQSKTVYFPYFELINMRKDAELQYSTSRLMKSYIENNHKITIILPDKINGAYYENEGEVLARSNAEAKSARYFLDGEIHYLQGVYIVSLGLYEAQTGDRVWHDMVKGSDEQDIDLLLSRLGRSFMSNKTAKTDIEIDEVTDYDVQGFELKQIKVNHFVGLMIGGKYLFDEETLSGIGLAYTYDATTFLFNMNFDYFPSSSLLENRSFEGRKLRNGNFSLGASYPFTRKRSTLYLDGGLEYGFTTVRRDPDYYDDPTTTSGGIGVYVGTGLLINRNSTVNLRLFSAVSIPLYTVENKNYPGIKFGIVTSFAR